MARGDIIERAAKGLPPGWQITITIEKGTASASLRSPYKKIFWPAPGQTLSQQLEELIVIVKKRDELIRNRRRYL